MPHDVIIWDIDNCLSDDRGRVHLIDWHLSAAEGRYERYNCEMGNDPACNVELFRQECKRATPVFCTGRPARFRDSTEQWLFAYLDVHDPLVLMRSESGEGMAPAVLKEHMLKILQSYEFKAIQAYDDVPAIIEMYRRHGIPATLLQISDDLSKIYSKEDLK